MKAATDMTACPRCGRPIEPVRIMGRTFAPDCDRCCEKQRREMRREDFALHLEASGLDRNLWSYDRSLAPCPDLLEWCLGSAWEWIWLGGPTGVGKTRALARTLVVHSWRSTSWPRAYWIESALWCEAMKGYERGEKRMQLGMVERAKHADIVIFDDFGQEALNDRSRAQLFGLIDHRYVRNLRTWFTTNANRDELEAHIGSSRWPQIRRRIAERGRLHVYHRGQWETEGGCSQLGSENWWDRL